MNGLMLSEDVPKLMSYYLAHVIDEHYEVIQKSHEFLWAESDEKRTPIAAELIIMRRDGL